MGFGNNFKARTLLHDDWRLTKYSNTGWGEIYNLKNDPNEFVNLWDEPDYASTKSDLLELPLLSHWLSTECGGWSWSLWAAAPPLSNAPTTTLNPLSRRKIRRERTIFGTGALSHLCRWLKIYSSFWSTTPLLRENTLRQFGL